jgi:hypothetical protein
LGNKESHSSRTQADAANGISGLTDAITLVTNVAFNVATGTIMLTEY